MLLKRPLIPPERPLAEDENVVLGQLNYNALRFNDAIQQAHGIVRHAAFENVEEGEANEFLGSLAPEAQRYAARTDDLVQASHYLRLAIFFATQAIKG